MEQSPSNLTIFCWRSPLLILSLHSNFTSSPARSDSETAPRKKLKAAKPSKETAMVAWSLDDYISKKKGTL
jgi:hypothetical protein